MIKKLLVLILVLMLIAGAFTGCGGEKSSDAADTVIIGTIYTVNSEGTFVSALAIKDGVFIYVGDEEGVQDLIDASTEVITLEEGMVLPSFTDGHAHGHEGGIGYLFQADLYGIEEETDAATVQTYVNIVADFIADHPEMTFIRGAGWRNGYFPTGGPTAAMLDEIDTDLPIAIISEDHHSYWVNSKALEMMGVADGFEDIPGGVIERDANGNPTGCFREDANIYVESIFEEYTVDQYKAAILAYQEEMVEYGISCYWEPMVNLDGGSNLVQAYTELDDAGELLIRVYGGYMIVDEPKAMDEVDVAKALIESTAGGDFQVDAIKILVDGVVEGGTAWLLEDYAHKPGFRSEPLWDQDRLNKMFAKADKLGITVHIHSIGDAATRMTVDACEYAFNENGDMGNRHAITHLQVVNPSDIKRMADLKMVASVNPYWFCKEPGYFYELEVPFLGEARANRDYPLKSFFDNGIIVSSASDFPVTMPPAPLFGIQLGVTRISLEGDPATLQNPTERASLEDMIYSFTMGPALQLFAEDIFGSIEVGKSADLVILDQNLFEIDPGDIFFETEIVKTMLKGETIF